MLQRCLAALAGSALASIICDEVAVSVQLERLRAEAEQSQRKEAAAKAVLAAAREASREGRSLSKEERSAVERPILFPEEAQEKASVPPSVCCHPLPLDVCSLDSQGMPLGDELRRLGVSGQLLSP